MIVDYLLSLITGFVTWLGTLFPTWTAPDWFVHIPDSVNGVLQFTNDMGVWVNLPLFAGIATSVLGLLGIAFTVKVILRAISHVPGAGGAG